MANVHVVVYGAKGDEKDQKLFDELWIRLLRMEKEGAIALWSPHLTIAGQVKEHVLAEQLERANLFILLLNPTAFVDEMWERIRKRAVERQSARKARLIPVRTRAVLADNAFFSGVVIVPASGRALGSLDNPDEEWLSVERAIRAAIRHIEAESPGDKARSSPEGEARWLRERLDRLIASVEERLRPKTAEGLVERLAIRLDIPAGDRPAAVARALVEAPARDAATMLADACTSGGDASARALARELLFRVLPFATEWRPLLLEIQSTTSRQPVVLPLRTETLAEVILAGADGACCEFSFDGELPQGVVRLRPPPSMFAPLFERKGAVQADEMMWSFLREAGAVPDWWRDFRKRLRNDEELAQWVDRWLQRLGRDGQRRPYFLFIDRDVEEPEADAAPAGGHGVDRLWQVVSGAFGARLPSLRLVRLTGRDAGDELDIVFDIRRAQGVL